MGNCIICKANCERAGEYHVKTDCVSYVPKDYPDYLKPRTNADRFRTKSDEELAEFLSKNRGGCRALVTESYVCDFYTDDLHQDCKTCWLDWLRQEADND